MDRTSAIPCIVSCTRVHAFWLPWSSLYLCDAVRCVLFRALSVLPSLTFDPLSPVPRPPPPVPRPPVLFPRHLETPVGFSCSCCRFCCVKKERKKIEEAKQGKDKGSSSLFNFFKPVDVPSQDAKVGYGTVYGTLYGTVYGTV